MHARFDVLAGRYALALGQAPIVMGIVNVTPDSFSDGGDNYVVDTAVKTARTMLAEGADIIDVGGESTRPGADSVPMQEELDRVLPTLRALRDAELNVPISIDTRHTLVADQALQSGADIINDVSGLQDEPEMALIAAAYDAPVIAMHWDKTRDFSKDIIDEMKRFFGRTISIAQQAGISKDKLILDPGFGFSKSLEENYTILRRLDELHSLGFPLLSGTSRKSMIGKVLNNEPKERLAGTLSTSVMAYAAGAHIFRVHDVRENKDALRIAEITLYGPQTSSNSPEISHT